MNTRVFRPWVVLICILLTPATLFAEVTAQRTVENFVTAFNEQDVEAMLNLATDDVVWMSVAGESIGVEANGSQALKAAMGDYFSSHPGSYSKIRQIQSSGPWVTTLEHAGREVDGQFKGQCAYAMYQLKEGLIKSVWYFSAHTCEPTPG